MPRQKSTFQPLTVVITCVALFLALAIRFKVLTPHKLLLSLYNQRNPDTASNEPFMDAIEDTIGSSTISRMNASEVYNMSARPAIRESVVFVTDGADGPARESVSILLKQGFYVLVGVKSGRAPSFKYPSTTNIYSCIEEEARSFIYEKQKGLEPFIFDINSPADIAKALYRLRELYRDYNRPLSTIIVNTLDAFPVIHPKNNELDFMYKYDSAALDSSYTKVLQSPYRLLQAFSEHLSQEYSNFNDNLPVTRRIIFLTTSPQTSTGAVFDIQSIFYHARQEFISGLRQAVSESGIMTVSQIEMSQNNDSSGDRRRRVTESMWHGVEELYFDDADQYKGKSGLSISARAIVHSVTSSYPRHQYNIPHT